MTLTFGKGVGLDCVEEGLQQIGHESDASVLLGCVLVLGLGEALRDLSSRTDSLRSARLAQAEPEEQHTHCSPEGSRDARPSPNPQAFM